MSETVSLIGLSQKVNRIVKIFDDTKYFTNLKQDLQLKTTLICYHEWITIYLPNQGSLIDFKFSLIIRLTAH